MAPFSFDDDGVDGVAVPGEAVEEDVRERVDVRGAGAMDAGVRDAIGTLRPGWR